ncbi:MAG: 5'-methylthioadenosine/S-adenosylhomocysteine nucleosidase [Oscillospiraceae bacterium]|nr:5'-methylthioadenosine/S-adenosylhomocysteine nucleosidase [Oscillospiraceae bacterium]
MKKIAVLAAMKMEAGCLIGRMESAKTEKTAGKKFYLGKIGGAEAVLRQSGMGMRRAEKGARALIENYKPDALILCGVSGGLTPDIRLHETVIATSSSPCPGKAVKTGAAVKTDEKLADFAAKTLKHAKKAPAATSRGLIVRKKRKARIAAAFGAACIDMESYAVAKTANEAGVPLLIIRAISDTFEPSSLLAFHKNGKQAAEKAAAGVEAVARGINRNMLDI